MAINPRKAPYHKFDNSHHKTNMITPLSLYLCALLFTGRLDICQTGEVN